MSGDLQRRTSCPLLTEGNRAEAAGRAMLRAAACIRAFKEIDGILYLPARQKTSQSLPWAQLATATVATISRYGWRK